ncbi:MAG: hypothetical protein CMQ16_03180 [Gammaproteobacteria bacterium]|nr:hypothetical protein [Gammaproteobacteria bacterium]
MIVNRFWIRSGPCVRGSFCWWTGKRHFSLNTNNDYVVSEQDYEAFHRDGYVTLKNVMTEEEMQQIERVYDEFNEGKRDGIDFGNDIGDMSQGQDALPEDFNMININIPCTHDPTWANNIFEQKARFISQQLHGKDMEKDYEQLLTKLPCRPNAVFPMHQDMAYWPKKSNIRTDTCTVSLAVNDANVENGCLVVLPGSQAKKKLYGDHFAIVEEGEGERAIELELRAGGVRRSIEWKTREQPRKQSRGHSRDQDSFGLDCYDDGLKPY